MSTPNACKCCGGHEFDGPWGAVFFCNTCGRSVNEHGMPVHVRPPKERRERTHSGWQSASDLGQRFRLVK